MSAALRRSPRLALLHSEQSKPILKQSLKKKEPKKPRTLSVRAPAEPKKRPAWGPHARFGVRFLGMIANRYPNNRVAVFELTGWKEWVGDSDQEWDSIIEEDPDWGAPRRRAWKQIPRIVVRLYESIGSDNPYVRVSGDSESVIDSLYIGDSDVYRFPRSWIQAQTHHDKEFKLMTRRPGEYYDKFQCKHRENKRQTFAAALSLHNDFFRPAARMRRELPLLIAEALYGKNCMDLAHLITSYLEFGELIDFGRSVFGFDED